MASVHHALEDEERLHKWTRYSRGLIVDSGHLDPRVRGQPGGGTCQW